MRKVSVQGCQVQTPWLTLQHIIRLVVCAVQVDILVVNCSLFNPTPSLSAMIVNHFKMKSSIVSYNLSGMGCSAGVIALSLAQELLQVPDSRPLWLEKMLPAVEVGMALHRRMRLLVRCLG